MLVQVPHSTRCGEQFSRFTPTHQHRERYGRVGCRIQALRGVLASWQWGYLDSIRRGDTVTVSVLPKSSQSRHGSWGSGSSIIHKKIQRLYNHEGSFILPIYLASLARVKHVFHWMDFAIIYVLCQTTKRSASGSNES